MKTFYVIKIETAYVDNETGAVLAPESLTDKEKLMDAFNSDPKWTFVELYTKVGEVSRKTLHEIEDASFEFAAENKIPDFQLYRKS